MTEKLKQEVNPLSEVVQQVAQICPAAVQNGKIDFERLRTEWSADLIEPDVESYNFTWVGKNAAIAEANKKIRKTLRPVKADSKDWENTQNLYIEGDNLDVLKLLQESYLGKVKMIYIDPPYNTGNDFVYCDDFTLGCAEYIEKKGQCDTETNERLFKNKETNGRFHSDWCSMIYPRLKIARDILSDDGVIFISIDDHEVVNLRKICDEVFGENNFVAQIVWECRNPNTDIISTDHEYCLVYAKCKEKIVPCYVKKNLPPYNWFGRTVHREYDNNGNRLLPKTTVTPRKAHYTYYIIPVLDDSEKGYSSAEVVESDYDTIDGLDKNKYIGHKYYAEAPETARRKLENGEYKITKNTRGELAIYDVINKENDTHSAGLVSVLHRTYVKYDDSNTDMRNLNIPFEYAKPVKYIKDFVRAFYEKDICVLDFFSGSATTAHAVMQLNAEDGGNRKFIMVQLPEATDKKSEAYKNGYKNICEIGKERIRRAGDKIMSEHPDAKIDTGFRVFRLDDTNMKDVYYKPVDTAQNSLLDMVDNIKPDRTDMDLLFGAMLERGLMLDMPVEEVQSNGITYYVVNNGDLIACFAKNIPESVIHEIANRRPLQALFRDSSFAESKDKINLTEIFKNVDSNIKVCVL